MNWQNQLEKFRAANPDLPEGEDVMASDEVEEVTQPRVDIGIERKGRGGKTATLVTGWVVDDEKLLAIASELKRKLGTGGSARGGDILIQGDRRRDVLEILNDMGYKGRII